MINPTEPPTKTVAVLINVPKPNTAKPYMTIIFALSAALFYGVADYSGSRASRFANSASITFFGQAAAFVGIGVFLAIVQTPVMPLESWLWTTGGGFGGALALVAFYKAMSLGSMTVIAPITAVIGLSVPVFAGVLSGERPSGSAWIGILLAVVAVALVADVLGKHDLPTPSRVIWMAVAAGLGFGMIFVCMGNASHDHGVWPLFGQRLVSVPTVAAIALFQTRRIFVPKKVILLSIAAGVLDTSANGLYLLATHSGMMSIVSVVVAMYPVATVFLAMTLDHERLHKSQGVGLALAVVSLALVSL
jgi:drug/metabolite transporter (DMT)-like permease